MAKSKIKVKKNKIIFPNKERYHGEIFQGRPNGNGNYYDSLGNLIYYGSWVDGIPSGVGCLVYPGNMNQIVQVFLGKKNGLSSSPYISIKTKPTQWKMGSPTTLGQKRYIIKNKTKIEDLYNECLKTFQTANLPLAKNTKTLPSKNYYGGMKKNTPHGYGVLVKDDMTYIGNFKKGVFSGHGEQTNLDGTIYIGNFKDGVFNGQGKLYYADGSYFEGPFLNGEIARTNSGKFYNPAEDRLYDGPWLNGKMNGHFRVVMKNSLEYGLRFTEAYFVNGKLQKSPNATYGKIDFSNGKYKGLVLKDQPHYFGKFTWSHGPTYEGQWNIERVEGAGMYKNKTYHKAGEFINDLLNGYAELERHDGSYSYKGFFKDGKHEGYGINYENGSFYEGQFKKDKLDGYFFEYTMRPNLTFDYSVSFWENNYLIKTLPLKKLIRSNSEFNEILNEFLDSSPIFNYQQALKNFIPTNLNEENLDSFIESIEFNKKKLLKREELYNKMLDYIKDIDHSLSSEETTNSFSSKNNFNSAARNKPKNNTTINNTPKKSNFKPLSPSKSEDLINSKFEGMLGLDEVKNELKNILALKYLQGDNFKISDMHMVFSGNAGTGKTSAARVFADIFYESGIIDTNNLVETSFSALYGPYVGHSLKALNEKIEEAQGGILFIDEAHQLTTEGDKSMFNKELVNALITMLENQRGSTIVILAGYKEPMESMLKNVDKGLSSRISRTINFRDFNPSELLEIFKIMLAKEKNSKNTPFKLDKAAESEAKKVLTILKAKRGANFGNARDVRVLVRKTLESFARTNSDTDNTIISVEDIQSIVRGKDQKEHYISQICSQWDTTLEK